MAEFLFEIGLEEVPARMLAGAEAELRRRVVGMLERERLVELGLGAETAAESFSTPRRLAVRVRGVRERQKDAAEELTGPSAKIAYKDGLPGPAAVAFAKKAGVAVEALTVVTTAKGEYLQAKVVRTGRAAAEVIAAELPKELAGIYWAKTMTWRPAGSGQSQAAARFVRPVRWMLALLGDAVVPVSFGGKATGNITYGHRVLHGEAPVVVERPHAYEAELEKAYVVAGVEVRRQRIRKALDRVCRGVEGARWREDHELVETVTQLTEWPTVVLGGFEPEYLALPEEVLVTVMRDHQKYFAVEDAAGKLAPHFLTVLNTEVDAAGEAVIRHGNERVLRARFNDARFFWEFDQRVTLEERTALLEKVTFQKDLGSYAAKTERVRRVAAALAEQVNIFSPGKVNVADLTNAVRLAKVDLTTELVKEFTELQGVVGGLYARAQGQSEVVAQAIYDQYKPTNGRDSIPRSTEGQLLAIADKADSLAGMFTLGLIPSGSKDPFALRRAANGIVQILANADLHLGASTVKGSIRNLIELAVYRHHEDYSRERNGSLPESGLNAIEALKSFFAERVDFYLRETRGQAYDVAAAVLAAGFEDVRDAVARAEALTAVRVASAAGTDDFGAVSAAFKRMTNILAQAREKGIAVPERVEESLLLEPEETALAERAGDLATEVEAMRGAGDYEGALRAIAGLRPQVDAFFDAVMVMAPEPEVRGNRLALLAQVLADFSRIADFSEIVTAG